MLVLIMEIQIQPPELHLSIAYSLDEGERVWHSPWRSLWIRNVCGEQINFTVKTSRQNLFLVRPSSGSLEKDKVVEVSVCLCRAGSRRDEGAKLMIQTVIVTGATAGVLQRRRVPCSCQVVEDYGHHSKRFVMPSAEVRALTFYESTGGSRRRLDTTEASLDEAAALQTVGYTLGEGWVETNLNECTNESREGRE